MKTGNNKYILYLSYIIALALFQSCGNSVSKGKEGIIHYELIYIDGENSNPIITFLPNSMTYAFKKNKTVQKVEGWGGVFKMVGISDTKTDSVTALMKILGDKFKYRCRLGQDSFGYDPLEGAKIEYVDGEKLIAGLKCKKALAKTNDEQYELYYTEDLKIDDANWNTPFKTVKGVLMEYQIKMFNIKTKVIAKEVERIEVADDEFDIPEGYKCVSKEKIEESVYKFM